MECHWSYLDLSNIGIEISKCVNRANTMYCILRNSRIPLFLHKMCTISYDKVAFSIAHNKTVRQHEGVIDRMSVE